MSNNTKKIDIRLSNLDSSMIDYMHYHYDGHKGYLGVIFKSGDSYVYDNVKLNSIIELLNTESIGGYFNRNIGKSFPYKNIGNTSGKSPLIKAGITEE